MRTRPVEFLFAPHQASTAHGHPVTAPYRRLPAGQSTLPTPRRAVRTLSSALPRGGGSFATSREPFSAGSEASEASIDACCDSLSDIVRPIY